MGGWCALERTKVRYGGGGKRSRGDCRSMRVGRNPSLGIRLEMSLLKRMMETPVKARHALCTHVHGKHTNHMHTQNLANVYHLSVSVSPCVYLSLSVSLCLTHTLHIPFTDTWHTYALNIPTVHTLIHILTPHPHIILYVHTIHVLHIYCKPTITCTYTSSPHMNCSTHISLRSFVLCDSPHGN